jgi:uncharacterized DUF497 family protein
VTTWDEAKRRSNLAKHGVDFAIAERFDFVAAIIEEDESEAYGEQRQIATGRIDDTIYVYVYTLRGEEDHAISLRRATPRERRRYAEKKT